MHCLKGPQTAPSGFGKVSVWLRSDFGLVSAWLQQG